MKTRIEKELEGLETLRQIKNSFDAEEVETRELLVKAFKSNYRKAGFLAKETIRPQVIGITPFVNVINEVEAKKRKKKKDSEFQELEKILSETACVK